MSDIVLAPTRLAPTCPVPQRQITGLANYKALSRLHALAQAVKPTGDRAVPVMTSGAPTLTWFNTSDLPTAGLASQWLHSAGNTAPICGQGTIDAPTGIGNSDWAIKTVEQHPGTDGHLWIARYVAPRVMSSVDAWLGLTA